MPALGSTVPASQAHACEGVNNLCSGFVDKTLSWGFWKLFPTGTYAIIGTTCVEFENVMKSTTKKN